MIKSTLEQTPGEKNDLKFETFPQYPEHPLVSSDFKLLPSRNIPLSVEVIKIRFLCQLQTQSRIKNETNRRLFDVLVVPSLCVPSPHADLQCYVGVDDDDDPELCCSRP